MPIADIKAKYLEILPAPVLMKSARVNLYINYGQKLKNLSNPEKLVLDSMGKKMDFNSIIEGLNFMNEYGYELVHPYGTEPVYFLMRKKKNA